MDPNDGVGYRIEGVVATIGDKDLVSGPTDGNGNMSQRGHKGTLNLTKLSTWETFLAREQARTERDNRKKEKQKMRQKNSAGGNVNSGAKSSKKQRAKGKKREVNSAGGAGLVACR